MPETPIQSRVTLIAGDEEGGPYAQAEVEFECAAEEIKDEDIIGLRKGIRDLYRAGHGTEPQAVIVKVDDV